MKKIVEEVGGEGLDKLLGERVTLFCANYIYTGQLTGVNDTCVLLTDAGVVYETGSFGDKAWKEMVPAGISDLITKRHFFGCRG